MLSVDAERQRLSLGLKQLRPNIWDKYAESHQAGEVIQGTVTKLTNFGAFVEIDEGIEGLVHVSEIADRHVKDPADELKVSDKLQVKILKIDADAHKIALSAKDLDPGPPKKKEPKPAPVVVEPISAYQQDGRISVGDVVGEIMFPSSRMSEEPEEPEESEEPEEPEEEKEDEGKGKGEE